MKMEKELTGSPGHETKMKGFMENAGCLHLCINLLITFNHHAKQIVV